MEKYDVAVIGGGPAGITLAKMLGNRKRTAIIRPEEHSMIYCAMPYAIEGLIEEKKTLKRDSLVTDAGAELIKKTVTSVDYNSKVVCFSDSSQIAYEKLVIATGATPFIPPVQGRELKGVTGFKTENDLKRINALIDSGLRKMVIVGAGAIGIELALAINARGVEVELVEMGDAVLPNLLDREMTEPLFAELIKAGIKIHLEAKVIELHGKTSVEQVMMDNGDVIHFDSSDNCTEERGNVIYGLVVFTTGMTPSVSLVTDSEMLVGKDGIIVNERMETNIPDVLAVGDCAQFKSGITGEIVSGKLATNAVPMAKIVGFNLIGQDRTYPGFFNGAATKVGQYFAGGTGYSESAARRAGIETVTGHSEVTTQFPIMPEAKKLRTKLIVESDSHRLIGAQIVSGEPVTGRIDLLTFAIQNKATVEELSKLSYSAQPYQSFYPAANGIVLAVEDILGKIADCP